MSCSTSQYKYFPLENLPWELIEKIAFDNPYTWKSMVLSIPFIHRIIPQERALKNFREEKDGKTYLRGTIYLHSFDDKFAKKDESENEFWYKKGKIHRDGDKPAIVCRNGTKKWYINGDLHRDDNKPAVIYEDGNQCWYINGNLIKNKYYWED